MTNLLTTQYEKATANDFRENLHNLQQQTAKTRNFKHRSTLHRTTLNHNLKKMYNVLVFLNLIKKRQCRHF